MGFEFDLLGDPIPSTRGKPGRDEHVPTAENCRKIRMLLVAGLPLARIAKEMGISSPTLRKHYFQNGKVNRRHAREMALAEQKAKVLLQLDAAAESGNVSAMKEVRAIVEAEMRDMLDQEVSGKKRPAAKDGKKAASRAAALDAERELDALMSHDGERLN